MLLSAEQLCFGFDDELLLENVCFTLSEGERIGLIGANGEGKTTLIRLALGELFPDSGKLITKSGIRIGYLAQNGGFDSTRTVWEEMKSVFEEDIRAIESLRVIESQISQADENSTAYKTLCQKYDSLNGRIAARDSYGHEVRIKTVLGGMGFERCYEQPIYTMSGGEKTRLQLCKLLLENPDLLVLDEPTNHLDMKTLFWLEEYLSTYKGAILTVSHDRYFLDKIVNQIYELENKKLCVFKGNYSKYKQLKAEKVAHLLKEYEKQQEERARMQEYVDRNLVRASTTKMAQSRRKALEKMELIEKPSLPPPAPRFHFSYSERPYETVLEVENLRLTAGEKTLLENASFVLRRGQKCAVLGDNGSGKSTLVKLLVEGKNPAVRFGRFVKYAYYDQENANLNMNNTVLAELWERHVSWEQTKVRSILAQAGLPAEDMDKKVRMLSGGERAKLALAIFSCENGNTLLLDEPTNHLDLPARESLESALREFDGTILFVSHDRYFIRSIADSIIEIDEGRLQAFIGDYDAFAEQKAMRKAEQKAVQDTTKRNPAPTEKPTYRNKQARAEDAKKQTRIKQIEKQIAELEAEEEALNSQLALPEVTANFALLSEKCNRLEQIKAQTDMLYEEYETLI